MIEDKIIKEAKQSIIDHNKDRAVQLINQVIADGYEGMELLARAFIPGISDVGDLFGRGQLFLPELVRSAAVMQVVTDIINASLPDQDMQIQKGTFLIATVAGDVHDIGKCIVVSLLKANGYIVHDLGRKSRSKVPDCETNLKRWSVAHRLPGDGPPKSGLMLMPRTLRMPCRKPKNYWAGDPDSEPAVKLKVLLQFSWRRGSNCKYFIHQTHVMKLFSNF